MMILTITKIVLLIGVVVASYLAIQNTVNHYHDLENNHQIILQAEILLSACKDAETGERGYILTGNSVYLEPYYDANKRIPEIIITLREKSKKDPELLSKIDIIIAIINEKLQELQHIVNLKKSGKHDEAVKNVSANVGFSKMKKIKEIINEITQHEEHVINSFKKVPTFLVICIILVLCFVIANICLFTLNHRHENSITSIGNELRRSNTELEQFTAVASHDLQEPLRMVASYCKLLEKRYGNILDDDGKEFITYAVDGATRMQSLINDLLDYSRLRSKAKPFQTTDLMACYRTALSSLQESIKDANIVCSWLPVVQGDQTQLTQVFQNLLSNAVKFVPEGTQPQVRVWAEKMNKEWKIGVRDNGIGIDDKYENSLFIIFKRLNNRKNYPGNGIGLAICKSVIERHGGKIWVESEIDKGTTFYFTIK